MLHLKRIDFTLQLQCYYTANSMLLEGKSNAFKTRLCSEWVFTINKRERASEAFIDCFGRIGKKQQQKGTKKTRCPS